MVTAVRNGEKYLEATIRSVINQNYPNLEYLVIDGGSTDRTLEIIKTYEAHISYWTNEPDEGLFDALNKGFARSTGDVMGWLNASDMLQLNGLMVVDGVLGAFPQIEWITGRPTKFSETGPIGRFHQAGRGRRGIGRPAGRARFCRVRRARGFWSKCKTCVRVRGVAAREITGLLASWNYHWYGVGEMGDLYPANANDQAYDANLVALPEERAEEFLSLLKERRAK
jgi:glycosyltransferase involved in cell wall biosynthesis